MLSYLARIFKTILRHCVLNKKLEVSSADLGDALPLEGKK